MVKRAAIVLLAWGLLLGALTALQTVFGPRPIQAVMLGGASVASITAGLVLWALDIRAHGPRTGSSVAARHVEQRESRSQEDRQSGWERPRAITDESFATAALVAGLALTLMGAGFGLWLILIGAGLSAVGGGGLVREARVRRQIQRGGGMQ